MKTDKEQIKAVLDLAQELDKTIPQWVHHVEQINQQQYERTKLLASAELEKEQKSKGSNEFR
ncbi:hypothetical protein KBI23_14505 [bacterium]|nr:hypothetical protein [bacterium]